MYTSNGREKIYYKSPHGLLHLGHDLAGGRCNFVPDQNWKRSNFQTKS